MDLAQVLDDERRRISEELHDRAGPNLAALGLNLRAVENRLGDACKGEVAELLSDSQALLSETIAELRDLAADLRPVQLDYSGLVPTLYERIERFRRRTGIAVQLKTRVPAPGDGGERIASAQEWLVYRVVQEALNNCAKHAGAGKVTIDLHHDGRMLSLHISDDGVGFDPALVGQGQEAPGMGLITMRERVEKARGRFTLTSEPGRGTQIRVALPLAEET